MTIDTSDSRWFVDVHGHKCNFARAQHYSVLPSVQDGDIIVIIGKRWLVSNKSTARQANGKHSCFIHPLDRIG